MELVYTRIVKNRLPLVLFLLCGPVFAKPGVLDASFEKDVQALMKQDHYAGMAIVVLRDGKEIYAKGFGFRDVARKKPMTPDTLVNFASITKSFSSAAVAKLVDSGKVRWDTPLKKYLPSFQLADAKSSDAVTIRDVLSHRTGIPRNDFLWEVTGSEEDHLFQSLSLLPANVPLRSKWQYSNLLFIIVPTRLIRAISGSDYNTFVTSNFLEPLGMQRSSLFDRQRKSDSDSATPYRWNGKTYDEVLGGAYDQYAGAGALNSSAREMGRWATLQLSKGTVDGKAILSAAAVEEMLKPQIDKPCGLKLGAEAKCSYGLGWNLYDFGAARRWYFHTGGSAGFSTHMDFVPSTKTAVIIATNKDVEGPTEETFLALEIHRRLSGLPVKALAALRRENRAPAEPARPAAQKLASDVAEKYCGTFENPAYGAVQISQDGPGLRLLWHRIESPLRYVGDDRFVLENDSYVRKFGEARSFPELHFQGNGFDWPLNGKAPAVSFVRSK